MTCLHPYPEDLRVPDWDRFEDIRIVLCRDCATVLEIGYESQSGELIDATVETPLETIY